MRHRRPLPAIGEVPIQGLSGWGGRPARNGILPSDGLLRWRVWNTFAWPGAGGVAIADALGGDGDLANDISAAGEPVATYRAIEDGGEVSFRIGDRAVVEAGAWDNTAYPWQTLGLTLAQETVTIDVAVWRNVGAPTSLYISTRAPGEDWITHDDDGALAMTLYTSPRSGAQNWYRSDLTPIEVAVQ